jgi:hypothetical protein
LDQLRLKYKSLTAVHPSETIRRDRVICRCDPFIQSAIAQFLAASTSSTDSDLESDLSSLTDLAKEDDSFPAFEPLFDSVVHILLTTTSESLFRQCASFFLNTLSIYPVDFLTARSTPEFVGVLCEFLRRSVTIYTVSKLIGGLAELASQIRNVILSIFPFSEMVSRLRWDSGAERWNSAFLGILCRCCVHSLPAETAVIVTELLADLLPLSLGDRPLSLIVHALHLLSSHPEVVVMLSRKPTFSILVDHLVTSEKVGLVENVLLLCRSSYVQLHELFIPPADLAKLVCSPQICLRAIELAGVILLTDPAVIIAQFIDFSILSSLCDNITSQTARVKNRSAELD